MIEMTVEKEKELNQMSRALVRLLRHKALEEGLTIRSDGYVQLGAIQKNNRFKKFDLEDFQYVVETNNKQRFSLKQDEEKVWWIRANQGHSINTVKSEDLLEEADLKYIEVCLHGTYYKALDAITKEGLSVMTRNHIHFASGLPGESGVLSGFRSNVQVLIYLNTKEAASKGLKMYKSANNVLLSPGLDDGKIPPSLFEKIVDRKTGEEIKPEDIVKFNHKKQKSSGHDKKKQKSSGHDKKKQKSSGHDIKLSKMLSKVLRHSAEKDGLSISSDGYIQIDEIKNKLKRFQGYSLEQFENVVNGNDKQRFALKKDGEGKWWIRANQGHSMKHVKCEELLTKVENFSTIDICVHGTTLTAWKLIIESDGLSKMNRNHIHFASGLPKDDGVISGMRKSSQILIYLDLEKSQKAGLTLFKSENGVYLSPGLSEGKIPIDLFKKVVDTKTQKTIYPTNE